MSILRIGSVVKNIIDNMSVHNQIGGRIYPIVADHVKKPFIVYQRTGVDVSANKDTYYQSADVSIDILTMSDNYTQSVDIAESIINEMPNNGIETELFNIDNINLVNATETYQDDVYVQALTFNFSIIWQ